MPTEENVTRKLRAILSADVKGYSILMSEDEAFTVKTLKSYRKVMSSEIVRYKGRVVDAPGDNLLAEFASVVDAVQCAVEVQKLLSERNKELPEDKRLEFRIGVNIGDVIQDGDNLYGEGVNIAARIEGLAAPGGVCISRNAYDHIRNKLNYGYEYLGDHTVKNIKTPVRVYKVLMAPEDAGILIGEKPKTSGRKWLWPTIVVASIVITSIAWQVYQKLSTPEFEPASVDNMAYPLPEKPSIAVLPFNNLSADTTQDYIADGISENIISALSNISEMFVIASSSTFTYKGKPVKVQQVSEDLGVRYVLEGSAQQAGNRLRVTAQLIDATTGHHLWSEKYDRDMQDLFALQDEIAHKIIVELQVKLTEGEQARVSHKSTNNLEAWSYAVRGLKLFERSSKENNAKAMELFERAVELDPGYVWAWVRLAWTHVMAAKPGWSPSPLEHSKKIDEISKRVLSLDEADSDVLALLGLYYLRQGQFEKAITEGNKSIVFGPTNAQAHVLLAVSMNAVGRFDDVIRLVKKAMRLHPYYPAYYLQWLGVAYRMTGRYDEALTVYNQLLNRSRKGEYRVVGAHLFLAELYAEIGKEDIARTYATEILKMEPGFSIKGINNISTYFYKDPTHLERRLKALRKAGLPEQPPLPLPDKPSIAVLAFDNLSGDPEQEYLADGITEQIITGLSRMPYMFVIARNSSFTYKGKPIKIQQVAEELGVQYVLEGSVQQSGNRIRVTAQLIDALSGRHVWSERYDRVLEDIFEVQDEIMMNIMRAMEVSVAGLGMIEYQSSPRSVEAYLKILKAIELVYRWNKDDNALARKLYEEAIALDPDYGPAYELLGWTYHHEAKHAWGQDPVESYAKAEELGKKAISLGGTLGHMLLMSVYDSQGQREKALAEGKKALSIHPNSANLNILYSHVLSNLGKHKEAIARAERAIRLNPHHQPYYFTLLGLCYFQAGKNEEALETFILARKNSIYTWTFLASIYCQLGRDAEARKAADEVYRIAPDFSWDKYWDEADIFYFYDKEVRRRFFDSMQIVGLK